MQVLLQTKLKKGAKMAEAHHLANRKHKDSLFVDYFSKDRDWKQHFLSLYNALHGTNLQVETTTLETAKTFLSMRLTPEQVARGTGLPLETVLTLTQS